MSLKDFASLEFEIRDVSLEILWLKIHCCSWNTVLLRACNVVVPIVKRFRVWFGTGSRPNCSVSRCVAELWGERTALLWWVVSFVHTLCSLPRDVCCVRSLSLRKRWEWSLCSLWRHAVAGRQVSKVDLEISFSSWNFVGNIYVI